MSLLLLLLLKIAYAVLQGVGICSVCVQVIIVSYWRQESQKHCDDWVRLMPVSRLDVFISSFISTFLCGRISLFSLSLSLKNLSPLLCEPFSVDRCYLLFIYYGLISCEWILTIKFIRASLYLSWFLEILTLQKSYNYVFSTSPSTKHGRHGQGVGTNLIHKKKCAISR